MPTIASRGAASLKAFGFAGRSTVVYDSDAQAYFTACTTQPDTARKGFINTLVVGLKADGLWTKIDWILLLASQDYAGTKQASRVNLRAPSKVVTQSGTVTYAATGVTSNGTTGYFNIGESYRAPGNQFAQNSCFLMTHVQAGVAASLDVGVNADNNTALGSAPVGIAEKSHLMCATEGSTGSLGQTGSRIISRVASTGYKLYKDGTAVQTFSRTSTASAANNGTILRALDNGGSDEYSTSTLSFFASGGGLTATDASNLDARVATFLTAIGAT